MDSPSPRLWSDLGRIGPATPPTGGYRRYAWTAADHELREWFAAQCAARGLDLVEDRMGNQWAWWGDPDADPGRRHRIASGQRARRRRVRRPARRGQRLRRDRRAAAPRVPPGPADRRGQLRRRGGRPVRRRLRRLPGDHRRADGRPGAGADRRRRRHHGRGAARAPAATRSGSAPIPRPWAGSAPSSSCTSSRAAGWSTAGPPVGVGTRHLAARPVAARLPRRGQPRRHHPAGATGRTRCSASPVRCSPPGRRPSATAAWPPWARLSSGPAGSTPSRARSPAGWTPAAPDAEARPGGRGGDR